ncbi:hypothetical protein EL84_23160 [Paenibacillus sp. VT-400]|uniref:hypothetical protein n=1 Tax=Paenibacillus sp. VT-400 TaxID=1495853 RepID=UPI00064B70CF|nr:hypothetical protein [Paenibacillus sp. VT-400]KLU55000.1 hypothetical protein EL84_23160 [Paenibacillus sp. VT-400]
MEEYNQFMQKINGWSEELLLRGLSQFTIRDIEVLEQLSVESLQLQKSFLHELLNHVIKEGRSVALGQGDEELLLSQYCRLTQYVQLSVQEEA